MTLIKPPCGECNKRTTTCKSTCVKYAAYELRYMEIEKSKSKNDVYLAYRKDLRLKNEKNERNRK